MRPRDNSDPQISERKILKPLEQQREEVGTEAAEEATADLVVATITIIIEEATKEAMAAVVDMKAAMEEEAAIKAVEVAINSNSTSSQITRADIKEAAEEAGIKAEMDFMANRLELHRLEVRETTLTSSEEVVVATTREAEDLAPTSNGNIRNLKVRVNPNEPTLLTMRKDLDLLNFTQQEDLGFFT